MTRNGLRSRLRGPLSRARQASREAVGGDPPNHGTDIGVGAGVGLPWPLAPQGTGNDYGIRSRSRRTGPTSPARNGMVT